MKLVPVLVLLGLLVTACSSGTPEAEGKVSAPQVSVADPPPAAQAAPAPQAPAPPAPKPAAPALEHRGDLNGDGAPEVIQVDQEGRLQIRGDDGSKLFALELPPGSNFRVKLAVYPLTGKTPLVHVSWPWCPRDELDNLFIWYDRAAATFRTDRKAADGMPEHCGVYQHQGEGRFATTFHYESFMFHRQEHWDDDHVTVDGVRIELLRAKVEQIPWDLQRLLVYDVVNPEAWFEPPSLYRDFKSRANRDWRFKQVGEPDGKTLTLQITVNDKSQGNLVLSYRTESPWVVITGLRWEP